MSPTMTSGSYGPLPSDDFFAPRPTHTMHSYNGSISGISDATLTQSPNSQLVFNEKGERRTTINSSVAFIPTPGVQKERPPRYEPLMLKLWLVLPGCLALIAVGVALEAALSFSQKNKGFAVPATNVFASIGASTQFLTAFFPSLLIIPLAFLVRSLDMELLAWQPYMVLDRGNARPQESIMLSYASMDRIGVVISAFTFRHKLLLVSTVTVLVSLTFQPLAGSVFSVKQLVFSSPIDVISKRAIGLNSDYTDLSSFSAAAGYTAASVYSTLSNPPFILNGWASAEFTSPTIQALNATMAVNTSGVQTDVGCSVPKQISLDTSVANNYTLSATSSQGCTLGPASFDPTSAAARYGVEHVADCAADSQTDIEFMPVFFWFYENGNATGVFCTPTLQVFNVTAQAKLETGVLFKVDKLSDFAQPNNITGTVLHGPVRAYNGLFFNTSGDANVNARATTILSTIPNAMFRLAQQDGMGVQGVFSDPDGFLNITTTIYTRYLALAAASVYFTPTDILLPATITQLAQRLVIQPLPTHILSTVTIVTGIVLIAVHLYHFRARRSIYLPHHPGDIASAVAMTSHSGFGTLLFPYDTNEDIAEKLDPLRFCLDRRTGAIVVEGDSRDYFSSGKAGYSEDGFKPGFSRGYSVKTVSSGLSTVSEDGELVMDRAPHHVGISNSPSANLQTASSITPPPSRGQERMALI